ncbi:MAG: MMPL family transporter [Deltaproteobacteria bacterium]|nr:MMPL family transporter [Deltaproteobacteria bacterium]
MTSGFLALARRRWLGAVALGLLTLLCAVAVSFRLRLDPNVAALLPDRGEAAALRRYLRAFGGSDLAVLLVRGEEPEDVAAAAASLAQELRRRPTVELVAHRIDVRGPGEPMLVWRHADARARGRLAGALEPAAMRARLRHSRALLLAPGAAAAAELIGRDPLRLGELLAEPGGGASVRPGAGVQPDGSFASDDGRARLVMIRPKGQALRGADARAFVADVAEPIAHARAAHPQTRFGLSGGHAIAAATERMLLSDMALSGTASLLLAAAAFALVFRRVRALVAVMPPLVLGTLWTAGIAAAMPRGLSAVAVAFMSVVVGVGIDTGVHVYAALLAARQEGHAPRDAARLACRRTERPVLVAAIAAAAAFAALGLSEIGALRQLGILCAGGELLTALAILWVTPAIGAWLERRPCAPPRPPRWTHAAAALTSSRGRAVAFAALALLPIAAVALGFGPGFSESIVGLRPDKLEPLAVEREIQRVFGGRPGGWVVLVADADPLAARARADRIAERLGAMAADVESLDSLTAMAPAPSTQLARLAERDALDLRAKAAALRAALIDTGFAAERFAPVLEAMQHPSRELVRLEDLRQGEAEIFVSRFLGQDGPDTLVALYVQPRPGPASEARVEQAVRAVDPRAAITGYGRLERTLRVSLGRDLPRVGLLAGALVLLALSLSLRRARDVLLALLVVVAEIAIVLVLIRALGIPLHAYDALVLPVLLGVTVDEGVFLLHGARRAGGPDAVEQTLRTEGPLVAATALTTAAGFAGLLLCDFDGLRHLGMVGALGSVIGLVVALVVVPAGLRLARRRPTS